MNARLDQVLSAHESGQPIPPACLSAGVGQSPELTGQTALLASWQSVAGCGASAATGGGAGIKWVGRSVSGGLFGVQCQATYSPLLADQNKSEHHFVVNTLITRDITDRWNVGVNLPFVYKYMRDPYQLDIDLSNGGLGDASLQVTRQLGPIGATSLTATLGLPTGKSDTTFRMSPLRQHQQLGFGKFTGSLTVDHTLDETWGLMVLGITGGHRGGRERARQLPGAERERATRLPGSTSAPSCRRWDFPARFSAVTTAIGARKRTARFFRSQGSWRSNGRPTGWLLLVGASLPYQYDAVFKTSEGFPKSPWSWGQWVLGLGVTLSPF